MSETEILSYIYKIVLYYIMKDPTRVAKSEENYIAPLLGL